MEIWKSVPNQLKLLNFMYVPNCWCEASESWVSVCSLMTGDRNLSATLNNIENEIPAKIAPLSGLEVSFMFPFLCLPVGGAPQTRVS